MFDSLLVNYLESKLKLFLNLAVRRGNLYFKHYIYLSILSTDIDGIVISPPRVES